MEFLLLIWILPSLYLIGHYLYFHARLFSFKEPDGSCQDPVTVVICARNEERNLSANLPNILNQDYDRYEVVVVNDRSDDGTLATLKKLQEQYDHLKVVENVEVGNYVGKKKALRIGIHNATYDKLLLTDADCRPASAQWLRLMVSQLDNKEIVLGFGKLEKSSGWVNKLIRWETLQTVIQYSSFALAGMPYMGVGRNLAYKKELFKTSSEFEEHLDIPSGDDDLFVSEKGEYQNVALQLKPDAYTYSEGVSNIKKWWRQKRRHMSTSSLYRFWPKTLLTTYGLCQLMFYVFLIPMILLFWDNIWLWITLGVKTVLQMIIVLYASRRFRSLDVIWAFPLWEFLNTLFITLILLQNKFFGKPKAWK